MQKIKKHIKSLWQDESAQGATEYILLLVVVVALVIIFKDRIKNVVQGKVDELGGQIEGFSGN